MRELGNNYTPPLAETAKIDRRSPVNNKEKKKEEEEEEAAADPSE